VFERFTERARQVVVLAQDEARALAHDYIGTEHLLLGLLREEKGIAARVLGSLDITADEVRAQVARMVGEGDEVATGQIPFTPGAKKSLELALREALSLGHDYIGTEHILLGLCRVQGDVAALILTDLGAEPRSVAEETARMLGHSAPADYGAGFPSGTTSIEGRAETIDRVASSPNVSLALGWALFGLAFALGLFVGWLIWG
jgi:ATP-dependent Clp protease ATP-binding subunit ClpC